MNKELVVSDFVENILVILSNLPKGLRNPILKRRIEEFDRFDEVDKTGIIKTILKSYSKLDKSKFLSLFSSWIDSLAEMDSYKINSILISYLMQLYFNEYKLQEFDAGFVLSLMNVVDNLSNDKKLIIWNCFMESIYNTPNPKMFLKLIPDK